MAPASPGAVRITLPDDGNLEVSVTLIEAVAPEANAPESVVYGERVLDS